MPNNSSKNTIDLKVNSKTVKESLKNLEEMAKNLQSITKMMTDYNKTQEEAHKREIRSIRSVAAEYSKKAAAIRLETQLKEKQEILDKKRAEREKILSASPKSFRQSLKDNVYGLISNYNYGQDDTLSNVKTNIAKKSAEIEKYKYYLNATGVSKKDKTRYQRKLDAAKVELEQLQNNKSITESDIEDARTASTVKLKRIFDIADGVAKAGKTFSKVTNKLITQPLHNFDQAIVNTTKEMLNLKMGVASYSSGSLISNTSARNLRLKYGLSAGQAYGFQTASNLLNVQSEEDLMYMSSDQRELFAKYMQKYNAWYDQMESSGTLRSIQEAQLTLEEFKQEISSQFLTWIAANKEAIFNSIKIITNAMMTVANIIVKIMSWLSFNRGMTYNINSTTNNTYAGGSSNTDDSLAIKNIFAALNT